MNGNDLFDRTAKPVEIDGVRCFRCSPSGKAILCSNPQDPHDRKSDRWIPVSQIHPDSEVTEPGDEGTLVVPAWLAADKFEVFE